jgi:DNA ligase D-like protein (predicted ligase)
LQEDESVASGRSMNEIAAGAGPGPEPFIVAGSRPASPQATWRSDRSQALRMERSQKVSRRTPKTRLPKAQGKLPRFIEPQLSLLVDEPPEGPGWAHEVKWDGYRMHIRIENGTVRLLTRTGLDWTRRYPQIARAAASLPIDTGYFDGELCAIRPDGTSSFDDLQAANRGKHAHLVYYAFDLLHENGEDLRAKPLSMRKERLRKLLSAASPIMFSDHYVGHREQFFEAACHVPAEGIISKRLDAPYVSGDRDLWRKVKCENREEFVIVGYTDPTSSRPHIGLLLLAYYAEDGRLIYAGRDGRGISEAELADYSES